MSAMGADMNYSSKACGLVNAGTAKAREEDMPTAIVPLRRGGQNVRRTRRVYVNARLELLTRALTNATLPRFADFFERTQLPFFRCDFRTFAVVF